MYRYIHSSTTARLTQMTMRYSTIANSPGHFLNQFFTVLPSGHRYGALDWIKAQMKKSFVPSAISTLNKLNIKQSQPVPCIPIVLCCLLCPPGEGRMYATCNMSMRLCTLCGKCWGKCGNCCLCSSVCLECYTLPLLLGI